MENFVLLNSVVGRFGLHVLDDPYRDRAFVFDQPESELFKEGGPK
jgi:hypothetical protein